MEYREVLKTNQIADGSLRTVEVEGKALVVAQVGHKYYAFDDACTHKQCSLGGGFLDGNVVECPCHGARFDVKDGKVLALPATVPLKTYPLKVEKGSIYVQC